MAVVGACGGSSTLSTGDLIFRPCFSSALLILVWFNQKTSLPASVNIPDLCCVQFSTKALPLSRVVMYELTSSRCHQPAVM